MKRLRQTLGDHSGGNSGIPTGDHQLALNFEIVPPPRSELLELRTPDDFLFAAKTNGAEFPKRFHEDGRVEWKSARYDPKDLADYFSMWANTQPYGGLLVVGVEKDGKLTGCKRVGPERILEFERVGTEQCPDARFDPTKIEVRLENGEADFLLVFRVFYREDKLVETVRSEAFIRSGDRKRRLSEEENAKSESEKTRLLTKKRA